MQTARYTGSWAHDDPHANFKAEVANLTVFDPMPTIEQLGAMTGIPAASLIRYILVKWAASGAEAVLEMSPYVLAQMRGHIEKAEAADSDEARLKAYEALRQMVAWMSLAEQGSD